MKIVKMTDEDYFKADGLNNSTLKDFRIDPSKIGSKKSTTAMDTGSKFHAVILDQAEEIEKRYSIEKKLNWTTKDGKAQKARLLESGKDIFDIDMMEDIKKAKDNVFQSLKDTDLILDFIDSDKEMACFFKRDGIDCKIKADALNQDSKIIFDLKKISSIEKVDSQIWKYKYNFQDDFYSYPFEGFRFIFIFVEESFPFCVDIVELLPATKHKAKEDNDYYITKYKEWITDGKPRRKTEIRYY